MPTGQSPLVVQAKVHHAVTTGVALKHTEAPAATVSPAVKAAFVEDRKERAAGGAPSE